MEIANFLRKLAATFLCLTLTVMTVLGQRRPMSCEGNKCVEPAAWTRFLERREVGTHEQGEVGSSWRLYYVMNNETISPWHDIPLIGDGTPSMVLTC